MRPGRLEGKVCVVTGATRGIGRAVAQRFAGEGATVVVAARDATACENVSAQLGSGSVGIHVDLEDDAAVAALYREAARRCGRIDVCVNNAGILLEGDVDPIETPLDVWSRVLKVNLTGTFLCLKHQLPHLLATGGGSIVNVSGMVAVMGAATPQIAYDTAKTGQLALTRDVAITYARRGIRCNAVCPGPVDTPLLRTIFGTDDKAIARRMAHNPQGRFGTVEEVAEAVLFLAEDAASWVNGTTLLTDGGISVAYTVPEQPEA